MADNRFAIDSTLISWARQRSGRSGDYFEKHYPEIALWERDGAAFSFAGLKEFAYKTRTPLGNFFLEQPPAITIGIPDFRTMGDVRIDEPSIDLIDTMAICQERQDWFRSYAIANGFGQAAIVGTISADMQIDHAANVLRAVLEFGVDRRRPWANLDEVYRVLVRSIESLGVLVMKNGIVGNDTHRPLDPSEFRGFALVDDVAPLIFVNGRDATAASIFTLLHELIHLALGESALTNQAPPEMGMPSAAGTSSERWCNQLTAEILIPREELLSSFDRQNDLTLEIHRLSRLFRASKYVVAQSLWDARLIDWDTFEDERTRIRDAWGAGPSPVSSEGGQFYNSETSRVGRRFGRALISDTLSGNTLFTDAYRLLSTAKHETFMKLAAHLGVT